MNKMGLTMSTSSKLRLLDECGNINLNGLVSYLKERPLLKITGDNLDIYIRTGNKSTDNSNRDIHLFASNAISCRVATTNLGTRRGNIPDNITPADVLLNEDKKELLINAYMILIGRIISDLKEFGWMKKVIPNHIPHQYTNEMSRKSEVFQLPIQMCNEAKYEDCIKIMEGYEDVLKKTFEKSHGDINALSEYGVVVGGDQLTRVRLAGAKDLRSQAPTAEGRFDHVSHIVCELWHMKQDFLDKLYKTFYKDSSKTQPGTLSSFRNLLRRTDVNNKVKSNFQAHSDLLSIIVKGLVKEQALSFFGMENEIAKPTANYDVPDNVVNKCVDTKIRLFRSIMQNFIDHFGYLNPAFNHCSTDSIYSYCNNLCIWGMQFLQLDDMAKEGDITRIIPSLSYNIPFFYSHSCLSKYLVECIDYIVKVDYISFPLDRHRILEGSFVNVKGGKGKNVESDLAQEHAIRHQKELIKQLGANKTENAMVRITSASNVITELLENFDTANNVSQKGNKHTKVISLQDEHIVRNTLRELKPFEIKHNRKCSGFENIKMSPFQTIDNDLFCNKLEVIINRVLLGFPNNESESDDEDED